MAGKNNTCFVGRNSRFSTEKHKKSRSTFYDPTAYAYMQEQKRFQESMRSSLESFRSPPMTAIESITLGPVFYAYADNISDYDDLEYLLSECKKLVRYTIERNFSEVKNEIKEKHIARLITDVTNLLEDAWNKNKKEKESENDKTV